MKTIAATITLMVTTFALSAQSNQPVFEKEGAYIKGTFFHDNGLVAQSGLFLDGKLHGEWTMYNKNGVKITIGKYEEGKRIGKWFFWQGEGKALREVTYFDGKPVSVITWNNSELVL